MEVPAILNLPTGGLAGSSADLKASNATGSDGRGFSDHLENNVNRIKGERDEVSSKHLKEPKNADAARRTADSKDVEKTAVPEQGISKKSATAEQSEGVTEGLAAILDDGVMLEKGPELSTAIGANSDKRQLGMGLTGAVSGNELPQAADVSSVLSSETRTINNVDTLLNEEIAVQLDVFDKEIAFDPLSQAKESSAHIAALTAGSLPMTDKVRFSGKGSVADVFNPSNIALSLDKHNRMEMSDVVLDRLQKPLDEMNSLGSLAKELGSSKIPVEGTQFNTTLLTAGTQQNTLLTTAVDKPTLQLDTPMSNPRWGENFNQKVQWVVNQSMSGAQIRLNPQHMGPIEVRIQMQNDQATVSFTAQHGATREAIDAALPRLREMFNEQNVDVVDIDVSQHSFAEQRDQQAANNGESKSEFFENLDGEEDSMFDQQADDQQRQYSGLFSDFA